MPPLLARLGVVLLVAAAPVGVYFAPSHGPSYPEKWDSRVTELAAFVERERALRFEHPIEVAFLAEEEFVKEVTEPDPTAEERKEVEDFVEVLRALGLVTGHPDLFAAHNALVGSDVVGLYVPEEEKLYVRGTELTPYVRATAVHELTHALQDQHFDLQQLKDDAPGDDDTAVTALIEGDAVRIEDAYLQGLSPADRQAYSAEESELQEAAQDTHDDIPQVLQDRFALPYVFGPTLLDTLIAEGGNKAVDAAFRKPPYAEAQVVDPQRYPTGFTPVKIADPELPKKAEELDGSTPFGQVSLVEVLGTRLGYAQAWAAVQGWAGDALRPYRLDDRTCVSATVALADDAGATRFHDAVKAWGATSVSAPADRRVHFVACDPGEAARPTAHEPSAFAVLSGRAQVVHALMRQSQLGFATARCMTDTLITALGPDRFGQLDEEQPTAQESQQIQQVLARAYDGC
ncbi:MAG TPA: hypothetical protein VM097_04955 [Mycobacteriales bacterium]|nr:hypothetical protein [Mycobacteriales bacterium]